MGLEMDRAAKDIAGAARYLAERPETTGGGIGCVGFCMGGSLALWSATVSDDIISAVGFYPALPWEHMSPTWPRYAGKNAMFHCSEADGTSAAEGIQTAKRAIEAAGGKVTIFDYPGTEHAFFNDNRPEVHHEWAASEAWSRTLNLFRSTLS
jgi:carboxymethylenebutenolidase